MERYINADKLLEKIDNTISNIAFNSPYQNDIHTMIEGMERVRDCVEESPAEDVVEVVRCKNCKYWVEDKDFGMFCNHWGSTLAESRENDFCSYGERRQEE